MSRGRPKGRSNDKKSYGPLGDLIRQYRMEKQMGLLEVAQACDCSVQFISNIEHGRAPLPWEKAEKLAIALEIPIDELQAANLAIRADFKSFMGAGTKGRKKVKKSNTALSGLKDAASLVALTAKDENLREILHHYSLANAHDRQRFYENAKLALSSPESKLERGETTSSSS